MNKREAIIKAALDLLEESGDPSSLNLRKTAARAGCAHTNVYNYFPSLEALKWALLEQSLRIMSGFLFESGSTDIPEMIGAYFDFGIKHPALYKLIWITDLDPGAAPPDTSFMKRIPDRLRKLIDSEKADLLHNYVHGRILNTIFRRYPDSDEERLRAETVETCALLLR